MKELIRVEVHVSGIVQGVGFRPFVYGLAHKHLLKGRVFNNESGVLIDIEGQRESIDQFISELKSDPPSLARIESVRCSDHLEHAYYRDFQIVASTGNGQPSGQELVYAARISLDSAQMQVEEKMVNLAPGMAVTVEIKTGQRRVIDYLLSPLVRYRQEGLRER